MNVLETKRLKIRQLSLEDTFALLEVLSDKETMQFYPSTYNLERTQDWINRNLKSYNENGFGLWAIIDKETNQFVGQCGITYQDIDGEKLPEIGYQLNKKFWNKGIATEIASAILSYGFENYNFEEIYIHTTTENIPASKVAQKIGMEMVKEYDKYIEQFDVTYKMLVFSKRK